MKEELKLKIGLNWIPEWGFAILQDEEDINAMYSFVNDHLISKRSGDAFERWRNHTGPGIL